MRSLSVLGAVVLIFTMTAQGQVVTSWTNAGTGDWIDPANWSNGVPASDGTAVAQINNGGVATLSATGSTDNLRLGFGANFNGTVLVQGGTLSFAAGTFGINTGGAGTLGLSAGSINITGSTWFGKQGSPVSNGSGSGTLLVTGGSLSNAINMFVGGANGDTSVATAVGYASQSDGTVTIGTVGVDSALRIGGQTSGSDVSSGTYALSGGTLNLISTINFNMAVGEGGRGTFLMSGGKLDATPRGINVGRNRGIGYASFSGGTANFGSMVVGGNGLVTLNNGGTGTLVVSGSAILTAGNGLVIAGANNTAATNTNGIANGTFLMQGGSLTLNTGSIVLGLGTTATSGGQKTATGYLGLSGGSITTPGLRFASGFDSTGTLVMGGGTLNVTTIGHGSDPSDIYSFQFNGGHLNVTNSGLTLTNNGGTLTPGGNGNVGSTTFTAGNNYVQNSGVLAIDIAAGTFDTVNVGTGTSSIAGTINVTTSDTLTVGQTFDVLTAALVSLDPGTSVTGTDGAGHPFSASVVNSGTTLELAVNDVPEPAVLSGSILTGAWLLKRRHRRGELKPPRGLRCA